MGPLLSICAFFSKIQNPGQSCRPSINLKIWKIWKWSKNFKKVGPIRGNPSYNSQCLVFWRDLTQKMPEIFCGFFSKIQNSGQSCRPSIDLKNWKIWKWGKNFKLVPSAAIHLMVHDHWKFEQFWVEICLKKLHQKLNGSSFFVKLQSAGLNFCHLTSFSFRSPYCKMKKSLQIFLSNWCENRGATLTPSKKQCAPYWYIYVKDLLTTSTLDLSLESKSSHSLDIRCMPSTLKAISL